MHTLRDIFNSAIINPLFIDADLDVIIIGYNRVELNEIFLSNMRYDMLILMLDGIITRNELVLFGKKSLFYGYNTTKLIDGLKDGTLLSLLNDLRLISKIYTIPSQLNNYVSLMVSMGIEHSRLDRLLTCTNIYAEICRRIVNNQRLAPLSYCLSHHMYKFDPEYIINNIGLYKYLNMVKYTNILTYHKPIKCDDILNEIDMMNKMHGIPYINCNTGAIINYYDSITSGKLSLTLLIYGKVDGVSDITFDEYYDDELIFLLWNNGKFKPYNIQDINACTSTEDMTIKMVDSNNDIVLDTQLLSSLLTKCIQPYITQEIINVYENVDQELIDPNDVYPLMMRILKVTKYISSILDLPDTLVKYISSNKEKCKEYLKDMYLMALYFRRWKGPGNPIPYKREDADNRDVIPELTAADLIYKYKKLIENSDILGFLEVCPVYKDNTLIHGSKPIKDLFKDTILGISCIRISSSSFLYTSHRIYTTIFGPLDCDIDKFEKIRLYAPEETTII